MMSRPPERCLVFYGPKHQIPPGCHYVAEGICPCGSGRPVVYIRQGDWRAFDEVVAMLAVDCWFERAEFGLGALKALGRMTGELRAGEN